MGKRRDRVEFFSYPFEDAVALGIAEADSDFKDLASAISLISEISGIPEEDVYITEQVHGVGLAEAASGQEKNSLNIFPGKDGVFFAGSAGRRAACIRVADCIPVFGVSDGVLKGAFHAGWKGLAGGIASEFADRLTEEERENTLFLAGPHICGNCMEIGPEVAGLFPHAAVSGNRLNMFLALKLQLESKGVPGDNVNLLKAREYCTFENHSYCSHRRGDSCRMIAFAFKT